MRSLRTTTLLLLLLPLLLLTLGGCTLFNLNQKAPLTVAERDSLRSEAATLRAEGRQYREKSDFASALDLQVRALDLSLRCGDTLYIVQDYNQLGTTFRRLGRLEQALGYHYQALGYAEASSDTSAQAVKNRVVSLNGLGNVHLTLGNDQMAERCFRRALAGETQLGSALGMAINYANLGSILQGRHQLDSARWYYQQSMALNEQTGSQMGVSLCHVHFGNVYEELDSLQAAEREFRTAADMMTDNEDRWHAVEPLLALSDNLFKQGRIAEARTYVDEVLQIATDLHSLEYLEEATSLKARLLEGQGDYRGALAAYRQSQAWGDSLNNADRNHELRDLCIAFEQQQTQREMRQLQETYDQNQWMHRIIQLIEALLLLTAVIAIGMIWYASHNRKLRLQAMARLDTMRMTFLRNITHEFRTPLTVILGLAQQLKAGDLPASRRQHCLQSIEHQGRSLLELVNQLLSLSRIAAGFAPREWRHGDVNAFLRMTISNYSDFARMRQLTLSFASPLPSIEADFVAEYYDKIISNLVGNAFKHTPAGGSVTVQTALVMDRLQLDVIDTGTGIPEADLPHVFELFYQGENARMEGSTGLGLPYVRQMVEQMGGSIEARSNTPRGTDVHIELPIHCPQEDVHITPWSLEQAVQGSPTDVEPPSYLRGMSGQSLADMERVDGESAESEKPLLLIVDDNADISDYMSLTLQPHYRVLKAADGYEALRKATQHLPDLIITDLMMPGMDGYQLCSAIRQSQVLADVPIVIVSARSDDEDRVRGYEDGADGFLLKPFNPDELRAMVSRLLRQRIGLRQRMQSLIARDSLTDVTVSDGAAFTPTASMDVAEMRRLLDRLHEVVDEQMVAGDLQLDTLASRLNMSRSTLNRRVKEITGCAPSAYVLQLRLDHACQLLRDEAAKGIGDVAVECGFDDVSYFSRVFRQSYEMTPSQYRARHCA